MTKIKIDDRIKSVLMPLSKEELERLEKNIVDEGCRDSLVVWNGILIDGHNRHDICQRHNVAFTTTEISLPDFESAYNWVINNQLGRRNVTKEQASYLRGKRYQAEKKREGAPKGNERAKKQLGQNVLVDPSPTHEPTSEVIAKEFKVSDRTIKRDEQYAKAVDVVAEIAGDDVKKEILDRTISMPKKEVVEIAKVAKEDKAKAVEIIEKARKGEKRPHVSNNTGENEWYTPAEYIEAARNVLGCIDLDPASSDIANDVVKAATYYTITNNGLSYEWSGKVWMNPPYSSSLIGLFINKLCDSVNSGGVTEAIVLVNNATETNWFGKLVKIASAVCFTRGRIRFLVHGKAKAAPLQGQAFLYIGDNVCGFTEAFSDIGWTAKIT